MNYKKLLISSIFFIAIAVPTSSITQASSDELTRGDFFEYIGETYPSPDAYKYINLYYLDTYSNAKASTGLQKLVYDEKIQNTTKNVYLDAPLRKADLYKLLSRFADKNQSQFQELAGNNEIAQDSDLEKIENIFGKSIVIPTIEVNTSSKVGDIDSTKLKILGDVYDTLNMNHYNSDDFTENALIDSAIEGLARGTGDKNTSYFPPTENKNFQEGLQGSYEGIGAYVDMPEPGVVVIVSPISGSPAEAAGLKGGDIIYSVNGVEVQKNEALTDVTAKIKGPAGTTVDLGILRGTKKMDITVERKNIELNDVTGERINSSTYYIQMRMFTADIATYFKEELENLNKNSSTKRIIIDLRNNPGGYLDQVIDILGHFVPVGEPVAVVKYKNSEQIYSSYGYTDYDFSNKKIILLVNSGTASASEILVGTLKDYYGDNVVVIGEQTFGKGSVQTQRYYNDGSALKYTVAKWYTGKTELGIDGIGIEPDEEVIYDRELWEEKGIDNQLERALKIR